MTVSTPSNVVLTPIFQISGQCLNVNAPGFRSRMNRVAAVNYVGTENQGGALDTPLNPIDNPDARIVNDCRAFSKNLVSVLLRFVIGCCSSFILVIILFLIHQYMWLSIHRWILPLP